MLRVLKKIWPWSFQYFVVERTEGQCWPVWYSGRHHKTAKMMAMMMTMKTTYLFPDAHTERRCYTWTTHNVQCKINRYATCEPCHYWKLSVTSAKKQPLPMCFRCGAPKPGITSWRQRAALGLVNSASHSIDIINQPTTMHLTSSQWHANYTLRFSGWQWLTACYIGVRSMIDQSGVFMCFTSTINPWLMVL